MSVIMLSVVMLSVMILSVLIVIDTPQSGLKGLSQTLNKLLRCATTPRCATAPTWQRPLASLKSRSETREVCQTRPVQ
jgi:hypothetical protein